MTEKIKKHIISNENFLRLFVIVDMNNNSYNEDEEITEEIKNAFKVMSIDTYEYYNYLLDQWKNSNAEEKLEEAFKRNKGATFSKEVIEETKKQYEELAEAERGLYKKTLDIVARELNDDFINKSFYVYYHLALRNSFFLLLSLTNYFHLLKKYEGTEYGKSLLRLIEDIVNTAEVTDAKEEYIKILEERKTTDAKLEFFRYFNAVQIGIAFSELVYYGSKGQDFTKAKKEQYEEDYLHGKRSYLEDIGKKSTDEEDLASSLNVTLNNYIRIANLFERVDNYINAYARDRAEAYNINYLEELEKADAENLVKSTNLENLAKLNSLNVKTFVRNKAFKKNTIKELITIFSKDAETKALADSLKTEVIKVEPIEVITQQKPLRISQTRDHSLNDIEPVGKEWHKINVNEANTDIFKVHNTLATYTETNKLEELKHETIKKKKQIKDLEKKKSLTDKEQKKLISLKQDILEAEPRIKEEEERKQRLEDAIKLHEKNLKELSDHYLGIDTDEELEAEEKTKEKRITKRNIKNVEKKLDLAKKSLNNRGLFLQITTNDKNEQVLEAKEGIITLQFRNSEELIKKFSYETTKLLRYVQNIIYETPLDQQDDYIIIDLEQYTEETGRAKSNYRRVRTQLNEALDLITNEYFRITGKAKKGHIDIDGAFVLVDAYFMINAGEEKKGVKNTTGKKTLAIHLGKAWRDILLSQRAFQWASIPKILDRISDKDVKQYYEDTDALKVTELGYYLYETLRKNLKGEGYYKKRFKMKTLVEALLKKGVLQGNQSNAYSKKIIKPLKQTLNYLEDIGLIEYNTNAFAIYEGETDLSNNGVSINKGLKGSSEAIIQKAFEDAKIDITFKVYNKETYDRIALANDKYRKKAISYKNKKKKSN